MCGAAVVRRVFQMTLDGFGTEQIDAALSEDKISTPVFYWRGKGINRPGKVSDREPYRWNSSTVVKFLSMQEYCGDVINFKTFLRSFKLKKQIPNAEENRAVFKEVHEPIVARADWEKIQQKRGKARKRKTSDGEKNMFSGLPVCADCGHNLWYHFNQNKPEIRYFSCSNYKGNRGDCSTTHYIRVDFLELVLLQEIRRLTKFASRYEKDFARLVMEYSQQADLSQRQRKQKELDSLLARDRELDALFNRMYEDNITGKIDDELFVRMSWQYTPEQRELAEKAKELRAELDKAEDQAMTAEFFIATVRKYTQAKKLTERMLNELIERIEAHQADKVDGVQVQRLIIHYNCFGTIEVPDILSLPQPEIVIQTRKGVAVSYSPSQSFVNF